MARVKIPRARIADGSLPSVCVVCGADAPHRLFPNVGAPSMAWLHFMPLLGLLVFWGHILVAGRTERSGLPFCDRHRGYWPRRAWFVIGGFIALITVMTLAVLLSKSPAPGQPDKPHWLLGAGACWMLFFLPAFLFVQLFTTRPTGGDEASLVLSGASQKFASALEKKRRRA